MVTIYGASDDLIEVEGDVNEEFSVGYLQYPGYIGCSDGTLLEVDYDTRGVWRFRALVGDPGIDPCPLNADDRYSDVVTIAGPVEWVTFGVALAAALR